MRFYDVQKGAVRIDGVDVKEMELAELRRRFDLLENERLPLLFEEQNARLLGRYATPPSTEGTTQ